MERSVDGGRQSARILRRTVSVFGITAAVVLGGWSLDSLRGSANAKPSPVQEATGPLRILSVTPSGEDVPPGREIVLQFDRPIVPIGRMERSPGEVPVSVEPELECEWRWLNTSALACQLGEESALAPATRYRVTVRPGLRARDGSTIGSERTFLFVTERPDVRWASFETWSGPGSPEIMVSMNQPVERGSIQQHVYLEGPAAERIPVSVEPADVRTDIDDLYWMLKPVQELPLDAHITLKVEPGIRSQRGPEPGVADRVVVEFYTFPEHRFLGVRCEDNEGKVIRLHPRVLTPPLRACNPLAPVALLFSSPVTKDVLQEHLDIEPDLARDRQDYDPWENVYRYSQLGYPRTQPNQEYVFHVPAALEARAEYRLEAKASDLLDEFGRPLSSDVDFVFLTDDRLPLFTLTHPASVLETLVETHVPLVVTNLDEVSVSYRALTPGGDHRGEERIELPRVLNVSFPIPLEVRKWLGGRSGAVLGRLSSSPAVKNPKSWFFSTVTRFQVHAKLGHRNAAVWVIDLASGAPVGGARVQLYVGRVSELGGSRPLAEGATDAMGVALLEGTDRLDPKLDYLHYGSLVRHTPSPDRLFFVRVDKDGEMGLLPLSGDFSVRAEGPESSWIPNRYRRRYGHLQTWGTTAQGVYRVGDTIQFKLYVRDQSNLRFGPPPRKGYVLQVHDPMDRLIHEVKDLELNEFGSYHGELKVPETGAVGWYSFRLNADFIEDTSWQPLRVLVADFTPAPFRVTTDLDGELFRPGEEVRIATAAKLHAGGPYADAQARVTVTLRSTSLEPKDPRAENFYFETGEDRTQTLHQLDSSVDSQGELQQTVTLPLSDIVFGELRFESAVRDDRGKYVSGYARARYSGRDRYAGIRQSDWVLRGGEPAEVRAIVVDDAGNVVSGTEVSVRVEYRETRASRVKGAGNAYLTHYEHEWVEAASCTPSSATEPVSCSFTPDRTGLYRLTASVNDTLGRSHSSTIQRWGIGRGRVLWEEPPGHHLPVEPEKNEYRVGETARFLIRNPFPGARALFTIERIGVQRSWVQVLENGTELVEVEVTPDDLPGFYFSVVVTSPRVEAPPGDDDADLGKPAFRMGYVRVPVRDPYKEIDVEIRPEKEAYRPREVVRVDLAARPRHLASSEPVPQMELAVAVLDEAVFDLIQGGKDYFDPYRGFYQLDALDVQNYNLLTRLIGIQNFEKKGANPGGGGAAGLDVRSSFKFVSYWNPSLLTDAEGRASIELEAPDNLTGWRVLVMAVTREDQMGLGQGTFVVNQPTELRPALPNQITEGDRFEARFTVMNRTELTRNLVINATVEGPAESPGINDLRVEAEPFRRYPIGFPVKALGDGRILLSVTAGDVEDGDALRVPLEVRKLTALESVASHGSTTEDEVVEALVFPEEIRTDVGRVSVLMSPSVMGAVDGAFRYMRDYPYACWEQKLTQGVMASHFAELRAYVAEDVTWEGHEGLPTEILELAANYQAPNGGMVYYLPEDAYASPYLSAYTALAFDWLRRRGHTIPVGVESRLHGYLLELLRKDTLPGFYTDGMASSVRAVALAALAPAGKVDRSDLDRYRSHVSRMDLFGKAHYLLAAAELEADPELLTDVREAILAHSNQSGGKITFSESLDVSFKRILHSSARSQCAILSALMRSQGKDSSTTGLGDLPFRLTRSITQERGRRDRWETTQENLFCMNALVDYARAYERDVPRMTIRTYLDDREVGTARFDDVRDPAVEHDVELRPSDPGREAAVRIERNGSGRLYYATRLFYSPRELKKVPINSGIEIRREYSVERNGEWLLLETPLRIRNGELIRVDLFVSLPTARNFVVVDDAVPGGLEPVNRDLATASEVDAAKAGMEYSDASYWFRFDDWIEYGYSRWSFYHQELRHQSVRFYSEYLPAGSYHLSYVAQAIAPGAFQIAPVRAEEMYDPDVFGQGARAELLIEPEER